MDGRPLLRGTTVFGFFPPAAFAHQTGLSVTDSRRGELDLPGEPPVDLTGRSSRHFSDPAQLPGPMLLMLDRVTGYWPHAGRAGLGRLRGEQDTDQGAWYFKAHFFQDPVQPGSLGVQAMCRSSS